MSPIALLIALAAAAGPDQVFISYQVRSGGHEISGVSRSLAWSAEALTEGRQHLRLSVPVESFESGHPQFDAALLATLGGAQHPAIEVEGTVGGGRFDGTISLHGRSRASSFAVRTESVGEVTVASASFTIDLREYGVALPGVEPRVAVEVIARLVPNPAAVLAGGFIR